MKVIALLLCVCGAAAFSPPTPIGTKHLTVTRSSFGADDFGVRNIAVETTPRVRNGQPIQNLARTDVVLDPDYSLTWSMALLGGLIIWYHPCKCKWRCVVCVGGWSLSVQHQCHFSVELILTNMLHSSFSHPLISICCGWRSLSHRGMWWYLSHALCLLALGPNSQSPMCF